MKDFFYRVSNVETNQGLWYDQKGQFTGLIHGEFNFCLNNELKMDFDETIQGYLSTVKSVDDLFKWFTKEDIMKLQNFNYFIHEYETKDYRYYDRFQHWLINQENSILSKRIILI
jgi:hypothetical protein